MSDPVDRPEPRHARHARAFPDLEPPPGGLVRLRLRLRPRPPARALALAFVPSLAVAAAVVAVVVVGPHERGSPSSFAADHPSLSRPASPVVVGGAAGVPVPLAPGATLYWVP